MDCSPPGSSVHEIFQARILEWGAISFSNAHGETGFTARTDCVLGLPWGLSGKEPPADAGDVGLILGLGRPPGERNGNLLQYSCLENSMDRGAQWAIGHGVRNSWT